MGGAPSVIFPVDSGAILNARESSARSPALWLGGQDVIGDAVFFNKQDICWVLSLGPQAPPPNVKLAGREQINLADTPSANLGNYFDRIVRFIAYGRHVLGHNVYVHCAAGISRSTTSICAYLMCHLGLSFEETLRFLTLRRKAVCPNQGFRQQLKVFERSHLRTELTKELRQQCDWYDELREADLDAVIRCVQATQTARVSQQQSSPEKVAEQNAYNAVRTKVATATKEGADNRADSKEPVPKLGNGSSIGDFGLGWLMGGRKDSKDQLPREENEQTGERQTEQQMGRQSSSGSRWSFMGRTRSK